MFDLARIAADSGIAALEYRPEVGSTNEWGAAEGALTFSLVIDAQAWSVRSENWPQIALVAGLAVCESLHTLYPPGIFGLKWPNDVLLHHSEASATPHQPDASARPKKL